MFMIDAEFWVAVAFVIFLGVLGYFGVHKKIANALDDRRDRIKAELDEARRLKEEAQTLLAAIPAKAAGGRSARPRRSSTSAKAEAERMAHEAKAKIEEFVARRTKMAETKIAQAEAQALADVRAAAADAAVAAAERILKHRQGQGGGRPDRARYRRRQEQAQLARLSNALGQAGRAITGCPRPRICKQPRPYARPLPTADRRADRFCQAIRPNAIRPRQKPAEHRGDP